MKVVELLYDSDVTIKESVLRLLTEVLDLLDPEFKRKKLVKAIKDKLANLHEDEVLPFSKHCGPIIEKMIPFMDKSPQLLPDFLNYFRELALWKDKAIRSNFLFNLPGVLTFTDFKYFLALRHHYMRLFDDKSPDVRLVLYRTLPVIMEAVGDEETLSLVRPLLLKAIREETTLPNLQVLIENLGKWFTIFLIEASLEKSPKPTSLDIFPELQSGFHWVNPMFSAASLNDPIKDDIELVSCAAVLWKKISGTSAWRTELVLIDQIVKCIPSVSSSSFIAFCLPSLWNRLKEGNKPVKSQCINLAIQTIKSYFRRDIVKFIMKHFNELFHKSKSFQDRVTYLEFIGKCLEEFSRDFLRTYAYQPLLETITEPVPAVRLAFLSILPAFRLALNEEDALVIEKLNHLIGSWSNEASTSKVLKEKLWGAKDAIRYRLSSRENASEVALSFQIRKADEEDKLLDEMREIEEIKRKSQEELSKETVDSLRGNKKAHVKSTIQREEINNERKQTLVKPGIDKKPLNKPARPLKTGLTVVSQPIQRKSFILHQ